MSGRHKLILLFCFLFCTVGSAAQDTLVLLQQPRWDSAYNMEAYAGYYTDESNEESPETVKQKTFVRDSNYYRSLQKNYGRKFVTAWIKWVIHNPLSQPEQAALYFSRRSFFAVYFDDENGFRFIKDNSAFISFKTKDERRSFLFTTNPAATVTVYVRMKNAYQNFVPDYPDIIRPAEYKQVMGNSLFYHRYFLFADVLFLSIIFFITLHTLAQYFFNRRKEFLLYAFYAGCVLFFLLKFDDVSYIDILFSHLPYLHKFGNNPLSYLLFFAYYRFVREFIDFKKIAPWFYRTIIITEKILLTVIATDVLLSQLNFFLKRFSSSI